MESEHEQAAILVNTGPSVPEDDAVDLKAPEFEEVSLQCIRMQHRLGSDASPLQDGGYSADVLVSNLTLIDEPPREAPQLAVDLSPQEYATERQSRTQHCRNTPLCAVLTAHYCAARRRLSEIAARKRSMGSEEDEWLESEETVMVEKQPAQ